MTDRCICLICDCERTLYGLPESDHSDVRSSEKE